MIYLFLVSYAALLVYGASRLGIGPTEAKIIFSNPLYHFLYLLKSSELFVRMPNIILTLINIYLYYLLSLRILKYSSDALLSAVIFAMLPAMIGSGIVISKAPFILFLTLLMIYFYEQRALSLPLVLVLLFVDHAFAILFLAIALYETYRKNLIAIYFWGLFIASIILFGFDVGGKPKSYFLDTFGVFSAIFSPFLFLYFFYTIYRILVKEKKDLIWFIAATSFLFSLLLSFRQRINLLDFAPFAIVGVVLMVKVFMHSLRVRIGRYKRRMRLYFAIVLGFLVLNDALLVFNDSLFGVIPFKKHFAYRHYEAKLLAQTLKKNNIRCIQTGETLSKQLKFYKIGSCSDNLLLQRPKPGAQKIELKVSKKVVQIYYVSKSDTSKKDVTKLHK